METPNPVAIVKSAFTPGKMLALAAGIFAVAVVFDIFGVTQWLLYPYTSAKAKWGKPAA